MVLKEVDQKDLAIALRGVSEDVRGRIFGNMSERGAELLREEIDFQPPQRKRVVEEAQGRIVGVVRRLEEAGAIVISRGAGRRGRAGLMAVVAEFDFQTLEPPRPRGRRAPRPRRSWTSSRRRRPRPSSCARPRSPRASPPAAPRRWPRSSRRSPRSTRPSRMCASSRRPPPRSSSARAVELGLALAKKVLAGTLEVEPERVSTRSTARCAASSSASA